MYLKKVGIVLALAILALSGCQLKSKKPLIDPAESTKRFGDQFVAVSIENGKNKPSTINKKREPNILHFLWDNGQYQSTDQTAHVLFKKSARRKFDLLIQFSSKKDAVYALAKLSGKRLSVVPISFTSKQRDVLQEQGIDIKKDGFGSIIGSREDLDKALQFWELLSADKYKKASDFKMHFEIETDPSRIQSLKLQIAMDLCLSYAGHYLQPEVSRLPEPFSHGIDLERIDRKLASKFCGDAHDPRSPLPVQYAQARIQWNKGNMRAVSKIADHLIAQDYMLGYVAMADLFFYGRGIEKDTTAVIALLRANYKRHPELKFHLGSYLIQSGKNQSVVAEGQRHLQDAVDIKVRSAAYTLGYFHKHGINIPKSDATAAKYFEISAKRGFPKGAQAWGEALYIGSGTPKNYKKSFRTFVVADKGGVTTAAYFLGFMSRNAQGTQQSDSKAFAFFKKASEAGHLTAKAEMGFHLWSGRGTKKDPAKGRRLLQEAAAKGIAIAKDYLKRIEAGENRMLSTPGLKGKPRSIVENLVNGRPIKINRATHPFLSGLSQSLIGRCAKTIKPSDLGILTRFSVSGASNLIFGSDYSNKNLGKAVGSQFQNNALISLGLEVGKRITCNKSVSGRIAGIIAKSVRANESSNVFINTCGRSFNKTQCSCLAKIGSGVILDIHNRPYRRTIIKEIIRRNPLLGFQIGLACGIVNY